MNGADDGEKDSVPEESLWEMTRRPNICGRVRAVRPTGRQAVHVVVPWQRELEDGNAAQADVVQLRTRFQAVASSTQGAHEPASVAWAPERRGKKLEGDRRLGQACTNDDKLELLEHAECIRLPLSFIRETWCSGWKRGRERHDHEREQRNSEDDLTESPRCCIFEREELGSHHLESVPGLSGIHEAKSDVDG